MARVKQREFWREGGAGGGVTGRGGPGEAGERERWAARGRRRGHEKGG